MSSTTLPRNVARQDFYRTPAWATEAIVPVVRKGLSTRDRVVGKIPREEHWTILDAGAGDGAITRVVAAAFPESSVKGIELDRKLVDAASLPILFEGDFFFEGREWESEVDAIVMNPPFSQAREFVERALSVVEERDGVVVALLRLAWMAGKSRAPFHREHPSDVYVLPRRPSFTGVGTDSADYGWFVWRHGQIGGRWRVLDGEHS